MTQHSQLLAPWTQSILFANAKKNLNRARLCLLLSERHWKKVALYASQLDKYDENWRNPQVLTKEGLNFKITNHQRRAIYFWEKYNQYKLL